MVPELKMSKGYDPKKKLQKVISEKQQLERKQRSKL